tara:strand:- start:4742 stop:5395 length:654 start_codon:yes stop_codon:yes gene_type:complete
MKFKFIEIGTADWGTEAERWFNSNKPFTGLSIEPLSIYLKKLPDETSFYFKEQCAISNNESTKQIYYIHPDTVDKLNGHYKWKGCNSIGDYHPLHIKVSRHHDIPLEELVTTESIQLKKIETIIKKYKVEEIDFLKIDTEGYDTFILEDFLNYIQTSQRFYLLPKKIKFESNHLNDYDKITNIFKMLKEVGYRYQYPDDATFFMNTIKSREYTGGFE